MWKSKKRQGRLRKHSKSLNESTTKQNKVNSEGRNAYEPYTVNIKQVETKLLQYEGETRRWIYDQVWSWYKQNDWTKVFVLLGYAGVGKSVFLAELCRLGGVFENKYVHSPSFCENPKPVPIVAVHFFQHDDSVSKSLKTCICSISSQLEKRLLGFNIENLETIINECDNDLAELFLRLVADPANKASPPADLKRVAVVIDALDECDDKSRGTLLSLIQQNWVTKMPKWIGLIVSSRPEEYIPYELRDFNPTKLDTENKSNKEDLRRYFRSKLLQHMEKKNIEIEQGLDILVTRSQGLFIYARFLEDMIQNAFNPQESNENAKLTLDILRDESKFPMGLVGVYTKFFKRFKEDICNNGREYREVVGPVVVAREPLPLEIWAAVCNYSNLEDFEAQVVERAKNLLYVSNGVVRVLHKSMTDFLLGDLCVKPLKFKRKHAHGQLADWCQTNDKELFSRRHIIYHMCNSKRYEDAKLLITNRFDWMSNVDSLYQIVNDISSYYRGPNKKGISLINNALRLSIPAFEYNREELASQLFGRLGNFDIPLAKQASRARPSGLFPLVPSFTSAQSPLRSIFTTHSQTVSEVATTSMNVLQPDTSDLDSMLDNGQGNRTTVNEKLFKTQQRRQFCASASGADGKVVVWDISDGHISYEIKSPTGKVEQIAFSDSGQYLCIDNRIYDSSSGELKHSLPVDSSRILSLALSKMKIPDSDVYVDIILVGYGHCSRIWQVDNRRLVCSLPDLSQFVSASAFSPYRNNFEFEQKFAFKEELNNGRPDDDSNHDLSYEVDPDIERTVAVGSRNGSIQLSNFEGEQVHVLTGHESWVKSIKYSPDGSKLYSADKSVLYIWDLTCFVPLRNFNIHASGVLSQISVHPDARFPAIVTTGPRNKLQIFNADTSEMVMSMSGSHRNSLTSVNFSPDGNSIVSASKDNTVRVWDLKSTLEQFRVNSNNERPLQENEDLVISPDEFLATRFDFSPDGELLLVGSMLGDVRVYNCFTGKEVFTIARAHSRWIECVQIAATSDGRLLAFSGSQDKRVLVFDIESGKQLKALEDHVGCVHDIKMAPCGTYLATCAGDRSIILYDSTSFELLDRLREPFPINAIDFSPDGKYIVSGSRGVVRLWNLETKTIEFTLYAHEDDVEDVGFALDSKMFVSCSKNNVIIHDVSTRKVLHQFQTESGKRITEVRFSNDGKYIHGMSKFDSAFTWEIATEAFVSSFPATDQEIVLLNVENRVHVKSRVPLETGFTAEGPVRYAALGPLKLNGERTGIIIEGRKAHLVTEANAMVT